MTMCRGSISYGNGTAKTTQYEVSAFLFVLILLFLLFSQVIVYLGDHGLMTLY